MTATELKNFVHGAPFVPFDIVIPGRSKIRVPHPDFISISPTGEIAHVWMKNGEFASLDILLITGLETTSRNGRRGRTAQR